MQRVTEVVVVEPDRDRLRKLRANAGPSIQAVRRSAQAMALLEAGVHPHRLVVALPSRGRRGGSSASEAEVGPALELLARARDRGIVERVLDGRGCDIERFEAARTVGATVWPASSTEEAMRWYTTGLELRASVRGRVAQDVARAHLCRTLGLTRAEAAVLFADLLVGSSPTDIGRELSISYHTVKSHFRNMRELTGLPRDRLRTHGIRCLVWTRGLVEPSFV